MPDFPLSKSEPIKLRLFGACYEPDCGHVGSKKKENGASRACAV
jgi:hypothetical protein